MKRFSLLLLIGGLLGGAALPAKAQEPRVAPVINYNGRLMDPEANGGAGGPLTGNQTLIFRLYDAPAGGALVWSRQFPVFLKVTGDFNLLLNDAAEPPDGEPDTTMAEAFASDSPLYLSLQVDGKGGELPRRPLGSAPFAFTVNQAESVQIAAASTLTEQGEALEAVNPAGTAGGFAITTATDTNRVVRLDGDEWNSTQDVGINLVSSNRVDVLGEFEFAGGLMSRSAENVANPQTGDSPNDPGTPVVWTNDVADGFLLIQVEGVNLRVNIDSRGDQYLDSMGDSPTDSNDYIRNTGFFPVQKGSQVEFQMLRRDANSGNNYVLDITLHIFNTP